MFKLPLRLLHTICSLWGPRSICVGGLVFYALLVPCSAAELRKIGVSVPDLGNPFFVRIAHGVETSARRLIGPGVQVNVASSAYDVQRQESQIDAFIQKKMDLIILAAADSVAIEPSVRKAQAAGIRVIAVDVRASGADATVTTDNVQAGELACGYIAQRLKGQGKMVILNGPNVSSTMDRVSGCLLSLKAYPGIQLLSMDRDGGGGTDGGFAKMTDLLTLFPRIDAVFAINDPTALGVEQAARQAGRFEFFIVGIDGAPKVKARMRSPDSLIVATVAQLPDVLAEKAVEFGYGMIKKNQHPSSTAMIPAVLLTQKQIQNVMDWGE